MLYKLLILLCAALQTVFSDVQIIPVDPLPCSPSGDPHTCLLDYITDTTTPRHSSFKIYGPDCQPWASQTLPVSGGTTVLASGLSLNHQLTISAEKLAGITFWSPKFSYAGRTYTYAECGCHPLSITGNQFGCACQFSCLPYVIDK